ncbi:MAG: hypothetical protein J07HB67_01040, partial [halophilic archaeon J07HB67]
MFPDNHPHDRGRSIQSASCSLVSELGIMRELDET